MRRPTQREVRGFFRVAFVVIMLGAIGVGGAKVEEQTRDLKSETQARIDDTNRAIVIGCENVNKIARASKAIIRSSTSSSSSRGFPQDIVDRIQDPAVRELLNTISQTTQTNQSNLAAQGEAIKILDCNKLDR